ncbi:universal stress protein UspA [Desulfonema ishimotonii]|uniref:Universal stress protein UspA n=1 Tax=Desulfonema ishimotonii TaxID=45657 RepID=A0A401G123_9BACT|nr:universal stress protein [Desulfonema ishimotonii]GBC62906.1 universal stress protein UspA [Desulfonema ishimotonii]
MKIMVGYDGSNAGKEALNLGVKHAKAFNAEIHVVHSMSGGSEENLAEIQAAEEGLAYAQSFCDDLGIPCKTHLLIRGFSAGEDLVKFAEEHRIDEMVVGVRRRSRVGKIIFGSVARHVIMAAPCPVVSVK